MVSGNQLASELQGPLSRYCSLWTIAVLLVTVTLTAPLIILLWYLFQEPGPWWEHIAEYLLPRYIRNTFILCIGIGVLTIVVSVPCAWLVTMYEFPMRKKLSWALMLPLALPTYMAAFIWAGLLDFSGPIESSLRALFPQHDGRFFPFDIMSLPGAILVLGSVLYPYVYMITRVTFARQSAQMLQAARLLGRSPFEVFWRVAVPLARPAIVAGVSLAIMETLNDYGAVKYYGVDTFTTAIFHAWFRLEDQISAIRLSACLLIVVVVVLGVERIGRGRRRFHIKEGQCLPTRQQLRGLKSVGAMICCFIPVFVGFLIPVAMLFFWLAKTWRETFDSGYVLMVRNSLLLALCTALCAVFLALLMAYTVHLYRQRFFRVITSLASVGYAIPGAVIAIGVMMLSIGFDRWIGGDIGRLFGREGNLLLMSSTVALTGAYLVRFLAIGNQTMFGAFDMLGTHLHDTSRLLGASSYRTFWQVELPLLKGPLLVAGLMVFVEVLKELPLTLILSPFNFTTLATQAYQYAGDEMLARSSGPMLLILLASLIPVCLLHYLSSTKFG